MLILCQRQARPLTDRPTSLHIVPHLHSISRPRSHHSIIFPQLCNQSLSRIIRGCTTRRHHPCPQLAIRLALPRLSRQGRAQWKSLTTTSLLSKAHSRESVCDGGSPLAYVRYQIPPTFTLHRHSALRSQPSRFPSSGRLERTIGRFCTAHATLRSGIGSSR
jgi:hypothetical protein